MDAVIYLDLAHIHPVVERVWHRTDVTEVPDPGQPVTMLCGLIASAAFERYDQRSVHGPLTQCQYCDLIYRQSLGWVVPFGHRAARQH
ncbi:hypothetical protein [Amycolatopsis sp. WGS_07]|uniref:hypothetical protein n=1 Tax=Amycolatopsis sp. WGS_07 TaxID=3076764 RepID=UPI0038735E82